MFWFLGASLVTLSDLHPNPTQHSSKLCKLIPTLYFITFTFVPIFAETLSWHIVVCQKKFQKCGRLSRMNESCHRLWLQWCIQNAITDYVFRHGSIQAEMGAIQRSIEVGPEGGEATRWLFWCGSGSAWRTYPACPQTSAGNIKPLLQANSEGKQSSLSPHFHCWNDLGELAENSWFHVSWWSWDGTRRFGLFYRGCRDVAACWT